MEFKEDLIQYRIGRSEDTIEEAELAIKNNKLPLEENRIYYSIFYIVSALALKYDFSTSKHSTLMGWFNQALVKESRKNNLNKQSFCVIIFYGKNRSN